MAGSSGFKGGATRFTPFLRYATTALLTATLTVGCTNSSPPPDEPVRDTSRPPASSSPTPEPPPLPASLTDQKLHWGPCQDTPTPSGPAPAPGAPWQCGTMTAPLDRAEPRGKTIDIALIRRPATDKSRRIGSLLFNFGGPGGSGVARLPRLADGYPALAERYDLVSFDPRGVAASQGVRCRSDEETERAHATVDLTPDTPAETAAYLADAAAFGAGCARRSGKVLGHLSTVDTARDMDLMRRVLGDKKLHYLGYSYGTHLGGVYAHLFPENVGRLVLDGVVDPSADLMGHAKNQTTGFQRALDNYLRSTGKDPKKGSRDLADLLARIDRKPLPGDGERRLTEALALTGITQALYAETLWPQLTTALDEADQGEGAGLLRLADQYNDRDPSGRYGTSGHAQRAISCADAAQRPTAAEARAALPEFERISPVFGAYLGWDTAGWCHRWPVAGKHRTPEVSAPGAAPILVVGTTGDPATPYEGAEKMVDELGDGVGVLLTYKGEGHTAYGGPSGCVNGAVEAYLLSGRVPADGKICT
ncbi:alpha/beta hydrolase [Streptomyces sp. NPDC002851]